MDVNLFILLIKILYDLDAKNMQITAGKFFATMMPAL